MITSLRDLHKGIVNLKLGSKMDRYYELICSDCDELVELIDQDYMDEYPNASEDWICKLLTEHQRYCIENVQLNHLLVGGQNGGKNPPTEM